MMKRELTKRIIAIMIFLGIPAFSTASGSHLASSSHNSGPPPILQHKGSRNNNFQEFAPGFWEDLVDLREHNRRRRKAHVEDCATKDRLKVVRRWDAKIGRYCFASPKQAQKRVSHIRNNRVSFPYAKTTQIAPSPKKSGSVQTGSGKNTHRAKPHTTLGWLFLLNGQTQAAMAAYREALRHNPQSAKAYLGLGITLKSLGKIEIAEKALLKAVKLNPRSPSALVHLGYLYAKRHSGQTDLSKARRLFLQASQLGDPFASIALLDMKSRSPL